ncbi:DUF4422 domain-containing protein [Apilactobacillus bombintestini]|uniref:DUF4422 domain-containing protein n=1 Tax=Apilactobacillus bombintestini TaxID=2419772 RepID=A0A387AQI2_9LACO|nr:DUF4422 domain-containing protein [Apilactobacillus bombintestini]AYF92177.1 DUF4422 domain-containing protein [Apilactobacillus bombintestini]
MDTKVYIVSHKKVNLPKMNGYQPIQVGMNKEDFPGYIRDNTKENISSKNANYCELTAQYWIWKNTNSDVKGLVHYRRFLENNFLNLTQNSKFKHIVTDEEIENYLNEYDLLLPKKRNYFIETLYSHYIHSHKKEGLDVTREVIANSFPEYLNSYDAVLNRKTAHMFNMIIAKKDVFDEYSAWLFDVLGQVESKLDISDWNQSEARVYGYISELLLDVWLDQHNDLKYKELPVGFIGNQHWFKKIFNFIYRKLKK